MIKYCGTFWQTRDFLLIFVQENFKFVKIFSPEKLDLPSLAKKNFSAQSPNVQFVHLFSKIMLLPEVSSWK